MSESPQVFVFDKPDDMFRVEGKDPSKSYRWVNDSKGNSHNYTQKVSREYYTPCKDPNVRVPHLDSSIVSNRNPGETPVIQENNERYVLCERPMEAKIAHDEYCNRRSADLVKGKHSEIKRNMGPVGVEWKLTHEKGTEDPRPRKIRKGR